MVFLSLIDLMKSTTNNNTKLINIIKNILEKIGGIGVSSHPKLPKKELTKSKYRNGTRFENTYFINPVAEDPMTGTGKLYTRYETDIITIIAKLDIKIILVLPDTFKKSNKEIPIITRLKINSCFVKNPRIITMLIDIISLMLYLFVLILI